VIIALRFTVLRSRAIAGVLALAAACQLNGGSTAPQQASHTFGLSLMTGMNSELFTLFTVKEHEGLILEARPITRGQFVMQAQGAMPSVANPEGINLFRKYEVQGCLLPADLDDGRRIVSDCGVFDELWKLRFADFPFRQQEGQHPGLGWAESLTRPSERQRLLLCGYGLCAPSDLACGEELFRLLRDIGDPEWVDNYRKGY
jgi:hypothetical protein